MSITGRIGVWVLGVGVVVGEKVGCGGGKEGPTGPGKVTVRVEPSSVRVVVGETGRFRAVVTGTADTTVTWEVVGGASRGTITGSGVYRAPLVLPEWGSAVVRARSVADPEASGTGLAVVVPVGPAPMEFVRVPAGQFTMGDQGTHCGRDQHLVTLTREFWLGQTEVTNAQYVEVLQWAYERGYVQVRETGVEDALGEGGEELVDLDGFHCEIGFNAGEGRFLVRDAGHGVNPEHPVKDVTWYGAAAYCDWLSLREGLPRAYDHETWQCNEGDPYGAVGYRLPTDAEWEYAAQYDDERTYPWGTGSPRCTWLNWWGPGEGCVGWTTPVASYRAEKEIGGKGLYDMGGNVSEWCNDWFQCRFMTIPVTDPPGRLLGGTERVLRGGSWADANFVRLRCAYRYSADPSLSYGTIGFRVARTVNP